ncbi:MAG: DUF3343 domain-containing protein [Firmicutes bacterium]|nr:DUF3343 domain-containing protein [Bacillota bacterium]
MKHAYFTFPTTFQALKAEKVLTGKDWKFKMVPVPRSISSSCGTALRCRPEDAEAIRALFLETLVETNGYYELEENRPSGSRFFLKKKGNGN